MKRLRLREVKQFVWGHATNKWLKLDLNSSIRILSCYFPAAHFTLTPDPYLLLRFDISGVYSQDEWLCPHAEWLEAPSSNFCHLCLFSCLSLLPNSRTFKTHSAWQTAELSPFCEKWVIENAEWWLWGFGVQGLPPLSSSLHLLYYLV